MIPTPVQVTFRGLGHSAALETEIRERAAWLAQFYSRIVRCHVALQLSHPHGSPKRSFHVGITLTVPGGPPMVVSHEGISGEPDDARLAIHDAFDKARRQLEDLARLRRGDVKSRESQ